MSDQDKTAAQVKASLVLQARIDDAVLRSIQMGLMTLGDDGLARLTKAGQKHYAQRARELQGGWAE